MTETRKKKTPKVLPVPAELLVNGLFELVVVEDGANLAVAVAGPVGLHDLHLGVAHVRPVNMTLSHPPAPATSLFSILKQQTCMQSLSMFGRRM